MRAVTTIWARLVSLLGRRRYARKPTNATVDWHPFGSKVGHISSLIDLSQGGAFVRAAYPRDVGTPIVLDLPTPKGVVHVHARVAWAGAQGMGLRFTRPLGSDRPVFAAI
jgi:hypothetical protein